MNSLAKLIHRRIPECTAVVAWSSHERCDSIVDEGEEKLEKFVLAIAHATNESGQGQDLSTFGRVGGWRYVAEVWAGLAVVAISIPVGHPKSKSLRRTLRRCRAHYVAAVNDKRREKNPDEIARP